MCYCFIIYKSQYNTIKYYICFMDIDIYKYVKQTRLKDSPEDYKH